MKRKTVRWIGYSVTAWLVATATWAMALNTIERGWRLPDALFCITLADMLICGLLIAFTELGAQEAKS